MALFKTQTDFIGLDIGTTGLRLVQVKGGASPRLVTYGMSSLDTKITQSDAEFNRQQLVGAIRNLVEQTRATSRSVVAGLPSSKIYTSLINLPKMEQKELAQAIKYQAQEHLPVAADTLKLDWLSLGDSEDGKQVRILLVASPAQLSERYLGLCEEAGLEVAALEPDAFGLVRSFTKPDGSSVVILDIGANSSDLVIAKGGLPMVVRSVPVGGETFVQIASQTLNLEPEQAFQFVYKFGLAETKMEGQVKRSISSSVDSLISEVDKSVKYLLTQDSKMQISKLILTGKSSHVPELPLYIANTLKLPVEIGNSWGNIQTPVDLGQQLMELSSQFAVAAGLALRENRS